MLRYLLIWLTAWGMLYATENATRAGVTSSTAAHKVTLTRKKIDIEGVRHVGLNDVYDALDVSYPGFFQFWKEKRPMIKTKLIPTLSESLRNFYDSEGYYDACFAISQTDDLVKVKIKEGEPVRVNEINISSDFDIAESVTFKKGDRFAAKRFIAIKSNIISTLLKEGYCSYELDTKAYVYLDMHRVDLRYILKKGGVCKFGDVTVKGLKTIDAEIVKSRVRAEKGSRFSTEAIRDTSAAIYGLQSFDSVLINVDRKFYNVVPVDITVQEMRDPYHIEAGAGYDTFVGPRAHVKFVKHNFLGNAQKLNIDLIWSDLQKLASIDFYKPVAADIGGFYLDLGVGFGYSDLEYDGFREKKSWVKTYFQHESKYLKLVGGFSLESIEIGKLGGGECILPCPAYDTFLLAYPYLDAIYDARDSKLNPMYGYYLRAYIEYGIPSDHQASLYLKTELEARGIYTVSDLTMAVVGKIGSIEIDKNSYRGIPESKKFFGGGAYSNRAYGFHEIGVITSHTEDLINGALSMANLSLEADYPIWGDFYGAVFMDNTLLTPNSYDFNGDIISSVGIGVRYMTPAGPFKLDVGFNAHKHSIYGISFQIGQSF